MDGISKERLEQFGFKPVEYEGQEGVFFAKTLLASQMPYFMEHAAVDGELVFGADKIVVEVTPHNHVHLVDMNSDYTEEPVPVNSDEGMALLKDAGFLFD